MVNVIPFVVAGWHAPAGRRAGNPGLLPRPGSTGTAPPVGAKGTWARPTGRFAGPPKRRQPISRSGRDPGHRPYPRTRPNPGKQGRKHTSTSSLPIIYGHMFQLSMLAVSADLPFLR